MFFLKKLYKCCERYPTPSPSPLNDFAPTRELAPRHSSSSRPGAVDFLAPSQKRRGRLRSPWPAPLTHPFFLAGCLEGALFWWPAHLGAPIRSASEFVSCFLVVSVPDTMQYSAVRAARNKNRHAPCRFPGALARAHRCAAPCASAGGRPAAAQGDPRARAAWRRAPARAKLFRAEPRDDGGRTRRVAARGRRR